MTMHAQDEVTGRMKCVCEMKVIQCGHVCRSDAWVGEFQKASTGLSTNDDAKKSANAIFQVHPYLPTLIVMLRK